MITKKNLCWILFSLIIALMLVPKISFAQSFDINIGGSGDENGRNFQDGGRNWNGGGWVCRSFDATGGQWRGMADNRNRAMNQALRRCLSNSPRPRTCESRPRSCFMTGHRNGGQRTCVVVDRSGRRWVESSRRNACARALERCRNWHQNRNVPNFSCRILRRG